MADSLTSQPGPSKPTSRQKQPPTGKRKATNDFDIPSVPIKRTKSSKSGDKANTSKGQLKKGAFIFTPLDSKGKGKERADPTPTPQDREIEEDVKRMEAEADRLRRREAKAQAKATDLDSSMLPPPSMSRAKQHVNDHSTPLKKGPIDIVQPLPVRDTPTIDRNRQMRGEAPSSDRRSSLTKRGKRASSSFENKGVIPQPHNSLSTANFHKHIDRELPEAHRARHLLVWCASRAAAKPPSPSSQDPPLPPLTAEGAKMLKEIQKDVERMLMEKRIDIIFSHRMEEDADRPKVKPHEQNVKNIKREDDFMRYIDRCKREADTWESLKHTYNARQRTTLDALSRQQKSNQSHEWTPPDPSDESYEEELEAYQLARQILESQTRKKTGDVLQLRLAEAEGKVDRAHAAIHVGSQFAKLASQHLDKRFHALATALASRSQPQTDVKEVSTLSRLVSNDPNPSSASGLGAPPDTMAMLRALSRTDMEHPRREMADATRRAARDVQRVNATPGRSAAAAGPSSERRLTAVGSRGAPGTPRRPGTPRQRSEGPEGG